MLYKASSGLLSIQRMLGIVNDVVNSVGQVKSRSEIDQVTVAVVPVPIGGSGETVVNATNVLSALMLHGNFLPGWF